MLLLIDHFFVAVDAQVELVGGDVCGIHHEGFLRFVPKICSCIFGISTSLCVIGNSIEVEITLNQFAVLLPLGNDIGVGVEFEAPEHLRLDVFALGL
ncbi:hypothetical protein [Nitrincola nitratireducens]|uniref:Uncharacterized protein n=1 Tax=Nitrincola nitratireducens TaxID=1229521 RepID=W9UPJ9_9GAMM|nr:hypothetical protein [Nitrincola nitratireducens]EXJ09019.1 hypothetical protein D791_04054 [Nitrincola nitratireducens]